jgi:formylglycine-generating enzyme required for sulfatase activity
VKLKAERVTAPFEADVAKLNAGYIGGIDRKITEEKAAGHLDGIIALEAEKKLIQGVGVANSPSSNRDLASPAPCPIPADDAEGTTANLKALRTIYRAAYAKIEAARVANLKQLTDPLTLRLKQLEADLTKKDRVPDAKTVREYREGLSRAEGPPSAAAPPQKALGGASAPPPATAAKSDFSNSLGMKFVQVPGTQVLFCIHEVRYSDYAAYAAESPGVEGSWKDQTCDGYALTENKENRPVMEVNWEDAQKFCAWLSKKEGKTYRLPTDQEWSYAVGIGQDENWKKDTTPATVTKSQTDFPWGDTWPPPKGSGNYSDESRKAKVPNARTQYLENYDDGFPTSAPVMSFKPNNLGLYDLEGNAREWVEDWWDNAKADRVLRGGCWNDHGRAPLLSSYRHLSQPGGRGQGHGFRVVVVGAGG